MRVCKFAANLSFVKLQKRKTLHIVLSCLSERRSEKGKKMRQTEEEVHIVLSCLSERRSERGKKTRQTGEEVGRQHQGLDRPGVCQVPEGIGKQSKMEETRKLVVKSSVVPLQLLQVIGIGEGEGE